MTDIASRAAAGKQVGAEAPVVDKRVFIVPNIGKGSLPDIALDEAIGIKRPAPLDIANAVDEQTGYSG